MKMLFEIYCDGSTRGNGKENAVGAWAFLVLGAGTKIYQNCQAEANTTNQRMELTAAIQALDYLFYNEICVPFDSIKVYTDSAYLHNCYTQKWYVNWQNNGWRNSKKEPVANRDLWEKLIHYFEMPEVDFVKVKGHAGDQWNEIVDELAQNASQKLKEEMNI
jgi:ribonuclease HI